MSLEITLPALSPTMEEGKIVKWHKNIGDSVKSGDVMFEVETDKAIMEVEATDNGKIACIFVDEGVVKVNSVVGIIAKQNESIEEIQKKYNDFLNAPSVDVHDNSTEKNDVASEMNKEIRVEIKLIDEKTHLRDNLNAERVKISPLAKSIAEIHDVSHSDLQSITGSGPNNRIVKLDIEDFLVNHHKNEDLTTANSSNSGATKPLHQHNSDTEQSKDTSAESYIPANLRHKFTTNTFLKDSADISTTSSPASDFRKVLSASLTKATSIPIFFSFTECIVDQALDFVTRARALTGIKISLNDLIIKCCAFATSQVHNFNTRWVDGEIIRYSHIDIGMAISIDQGVLVRVIKNVLGKSITEISNDSKKAAEEGRKNKVHEKYVFGISNLGALGLDRFCANLTQTAIIAVGGYKPKPVVVNGEIVIRNMMNFTLTSDHRVIDGADAANWLKYFKIAMENPDMMLLI